MFLRHAGLHFNFRFRTATQQLISVFLQRLLANTPACLRAYFFAWLHASILAWLMFCATLCACLLPCSLHVCMFACWDILLLQGGTFLSDFHALTIPHRHIASVSACKYACLLACLRTFMFASWLVCIAVCLHTCILYGLHDYRSACKRVRTLARWHACSLHACMKLYWPARLYVYSYAHLPLCVLDQLLVSLPACKFACSACCRTYRTSCSTVYYLLVGWLVSCFAACIACFVCWLDACCCCLFAYMLTCKPACMFAWLHVCTFVWLHA